MELFPRDSVVYRTIAKVEAKNIGTDEHRLPIDIKSRLYYEAHITVEPIERGTIHWDNFNDLAATKDFRVSTFTMDGAKDFMSCRDESLRSICERVADMVRSIERGGWTVLRWKIEDTLFDSNRGDSL